jgi:D-glycero-D-manno-heptose 1,7-bisphosphate phosphatase
MADGCDCRKPAAGLLLRALADFGMEAGRCFMIGDRDTDALAGSAAGCVPVMVGGEVTFADAVRRILPG